jgi:hypothetical protein
MVGSIRWRIQDRHGNEIYLSQERWEHIIDPVNHPEMARFEEHLKRAVRLGRRQQDSLNPQKYRYSLEFADLEADNTHIVAIVLFRFRPDDERTPIPNNYIVTAYQKEIG